MSSYLPSCINLPIEQDILIDLVEKAKDWALMHGVAMRSKSDFNSNAIEFAPFVLLPSVIRVEDFNKLTAIQLIFNELVHKVACNYEFLKMCLVDTVLVDQFTRNLFNIYESVIREGDVQPLSLGLLRCDWMLKCHNSINSSEEVLQWKQVEINTIAAGFGWLGPVSKEIHRYILQELDEQSKIDHLPANNALSGLCEGMLRVWNLYGNSKAVILFVVESCSYNICDQRFHEYEIRRINSRVKVVRRTLTEIGQRAHLSQEKKLVIDDLEVALIYFRVGYHPDHYPSENEWNARLLMEKSKAIKCPAIQLHLTGTKKIQQELAKPGALELFLESSKVEVVREFFADQYGLNFDELGDIALDLALKEPDRFVLKPQREGGGNNLYGPNVKEALIKMKNNKERCAWILMEKIRSPLSKGYIIRPGSSNPPPLSELISELGIFGVIICDGERLIENKQVGHMLRTKTSNANEGGVATGQGALDSPFLTT